MRTFYHQNWMAEHLMAMTCYQSPLKRQNRRTSRFLEQDEDDNEDEQGEELALGCALKSKCSCD